MEIPVERKDNSFYGTLDVAARTLEDLVPKFQALWDSAQARMRPDDVKRMKTYLSRVAAAEKQIKATLKMFDDLNKK